MVLSDGLLVIDERPIFLRERMRSYYSNSAFFLSKTILELPIHALLSFILTLVSYFLVGLHADL